MKLKSYSFNKLCLLLAVFLISSGVFAADITTGLKLYYTFDAITGSTVTDDSGSGNIGTLNGAMLTPVEGYSGMGVQGLVKDDYIKLPADFATQFSSFTYATWVNLSALKMQLAFLILVME
ncbi:MAG: hypothetical protein QM751_01135 [Paludibacteraceae bacterium]